MISTPDLERRLQSLAVDMDWPETADVAGSLQLPARRLSLWTQPRTRLAVASLGLLIVAFTAALIASPTTRSAVARLLGFPGITVEAPGTEPLPTEAGLDLGAPTTVAEVQEQVDFPLLTLPLPNPQVSFDARTQAVHIRYEDGDDTVLLTQLSGEAEFGFVKQAGGVKPASVDGVFALWATGPEHALLRVENGTTLQAKLSGNALLWSRGRVTYRLETDANLEDAVRLAERLR